MPDEKKVPKSPYGQYSLEDVMLIEAGHYFIQVGGDIFSYDGKMAFSRDRAEMFYDNIFKDLTTMKENGDEKSSDDARSCLFFLRIHPMRIQ